VISQHALALEPMQNDIAVLDVQGFPLPGAWYVVHAGSRQLSVVAQAFFDYLQKEARQNLPQQIVSVAGAADAKVRRLARR
jgi:DNA-binding transcriptional LysR family regulator